MFARFFSALFPALLLAACGAAEAERGPVVLAAASLQEALEEAADAWAVQGHARPVLSFAGTPVLARQVQQGAPADLFVSADAAWMDALEQGGLMRAGSRRDIAGNALVMIAAPGTDGATPTEPPSGPFLALADTRNVPAGRYAREALEAAGLWPKDAARVVETDSVRAALALVEAGEVPFGVVYQTDALASGKVVVMFRFAAKTHAPIRYPAALLASSSHPDAAGFLAFLASPAGQAIFAQHGFLPAPQ